MKSIPNELVYALLFGAVMLVNYLIQRFAKRLREQAESRSPPVDEVDDEQADLLAELDQLMPVVQRPRAQPPAAPPRRRARRFSREALFASRRDQQDAFVIATILGRCRADEPHEVR